MEISKYTRIIIVNSYYYSGGAVVLSELCRSLSSLGYDARLLLLYKWPHGKIEHPVLYRFGVWKSIVKSRILDLILTLFPGSGIAASIRRKTPNCNPHLKGCRLQTNPFISRRNSVTVYPEYVYGNPFNARNVVRWLLSFYSFADDTGAYGPFDLFISYRQIFNDCRLNPDNRTVCINFFDHQLYRCFNEGPRNGKCYIIRKGEGRPDLPSKFDGPVIDDMTEEDKVRVLNSCEYCYSYDTQTFYSIIASICGCKSIIVPEVGKTAADYRGADDPESYGVAYGDDETEVERALSTRAKLIESLDYTQNNLDNARKFAEYVKAHNFSNE